MSFLTPLYILGRAGDRRADRLPPDPADAPRRGPVQLADVPGSDAAAADPPEPARQHPAAAAPGRGAGPAGAGVRPAVPPRGRQPELGDVERRRVAPSWWTPAPACAAATSGRRRGPWPTGRSPTCRPGDQLAILAFDSTTRTLMGFAESATLDPARRRAVARAGLDGLAPTWAATDLGQALIDAVGRDRGRGRRQREGGPDAAPGGPGQRPPAGEPARRPGRLRVALRRRARPQDRRRPTPPTPAPNGSPTPRPRPTPGEADRASGSGSPTSRARGRRGSSSAWVDAKGDDAGGPTPPTSRRARAGSSRSPGRRPTSRGPPAHGGTAPVRQHPLPADRAARGRRRSSTSAPTRPTTPTACSITSGGSSRTRRAGPSAWSRSRPAERRSTRGRPHRSGWSSWRPRPPPKTSRRLRTYAKGGGTVLVVLTGPGPSATLAALADSPRARSTRRPRAATRCSARSPSITRCSPRWPGPSSTTSPRSASGSIGGSARDARRGPGRRPVRGGRPRRHREAPGQGAAGGPRQRLGAGRQPARPIVQVRPADGRDAGGPEPRRSNASSYKVGDRVPMPPAGRQASSASRTARRRPRRPAVTLRRDGPAGRLRDRVRAGGPRSFAVNLDPAESRTAPLAAEALEQLGCKLAEPVARGGRPRPPPADAERGARRRQKLWRALILAAIGILIVETWLAGRLGRPRQRRPWRHEHRTASRRWNRSRPYRGLRLWGGLALCWLAFALAGWGLGPPGRPSRGRLIPVPACSRDGSHPGRFGLVIARWPAARRATPLGRPPGRGGLSRAGTGLLAAVEEKPRPRRAGRASSRRP